MMTRMLFPVLLFLTFCCCGAIQAQDKATKYDGKSLIKAAQTGDMKALKAALDAGVDVNAKTDYGSTALFFACDRGNQAMVKFLLDKGADPNVKDNFYNATPLTWARSKNEQAIVLMLFAAGGDGVIDYFLQAANTGDTELAKELIEKKILSKAQLIKVRKIVSLGSKSTQEKVMPLFENANLPGFVSVAPLTEDQQARYVGKYQSTRFGIEITTEDGKLKMKAGNGFPVVLKPLGDHEFLADRNRISFAMSDGQVTSATLSARGNQISFRPATEDASPAKPVAATPPVKKPETPAMPAQPDDAEVDPETPFVSVDREVSSSHWPGFRGTESRGIADGQRAPTQWQVGGDDEKNLKWKTPVPGLGMSCPTVWGDKVFVTTAVAEGEQQQVKIGLYGDVASVEDDREYEFKVVCLSKSNGSVLWERVANRAKPKVKRHAKSSHANPTVATNGDRLVAFFGSEGIYCYDTDGELKWKRDFGLLDSGWFYDPGYQWGFGSSPVIYKDRVIVQCDIQGQSFLAALSLADGKEIWRVKRDEIPTWATPTIHEFDDVTMIITNGTKSARGYDIANGKELWSLKGHSEIVVPTPSVAHGLIFLASGYSPIQPIYAVKPDARGDISLESNQSTNSAIQWSVKRGGPYMPTPIVYGNYLYCCANNGILSCYKAKTGKQMYKTRMKAAGGSLSFTASPIAADGHLFLTAEDGRVLVVKAGPKYELLETNALGESVLATPAVSNGMLIFRGQSHVIAVGE